MRRDCDAAALQMRALRPAPSIRVEAPRTPRCKGEIRVSDAARRLATAFTCIWTESSPDAGPHPTKHGRRSAGATQRPRLTTGPLSGVGGAQWNESPQAHEPVALGLSIVKPCFSMVSTKSMVGPVEVGHAHPVDDDRDPAEVGDLVTVERALVEEELVAQAGASAGLHRDAQRKVVATLLLEQRLHLGGGAVAQVDPVGAGLVRVLDLLGHGLCSRVEWGVFVQGQSSHTRGYSTATSPRSGPEAR